jgi:hypothetical protein
VPPASRPAPAAKPRSGTARGRPADTAKPAEDGAKSPLLRPETERFWN